MPTNTPPREWILWSTRPPAPEDYGCIIARRSPDGKWEVPRGHYGLTLWSWDGDWYDWRYAGDPIPTPDEQANACLIWPWDKAPGEFRALSTSGGGDMWVVLFPDHEAACETWIDNLDSGGDHQHTILDDGRVVVIAGR